MVVGFVIWSMVALVFLWIGISSRQSKEAVGFFTFTKPPQVDDIQHYNKAVSILWFVAAAVLETMGIPLLILEQNSPFFIVMIFAPIALVLGMIIAYLRIEARYKKKNSEGKYNL